jgi:hypothetical protein
LKVTFASLSVKVNVAEVEGLLLFGPTIVGFGGGTVSTDHDREVAPLVFPAASTARTANVWTPCANPEYAFGLVQDAQVPPSSWHWKPAPASESVNEKLALVEATRLPAVGPAVIDGVGGGVLSTV